MSETIAVCLASQFVDQVKALVENCAQRVVRAVRCVDQSELLFPGKMLRTRMAARLVEHGAAAGPMSTVTSVCAAVEMAHTASLCHDDVIDCAPLRRARPTLWRVKGPSAAVLIGDLLLCEAMELIGDTDRGRLIGPFTSKMREVCIAETQQELEVRGRRLSAAACEDLARRKTGPFFALVCGICGGDDEVRSAALDEAGYRVGTAYQLADDWVDVAGSEAVAGKTLGTDKRRGKFTLAQAKGADRAAVHGRVADLLRSALACLESWPSSRAAVRDFLRLDLQPVFGHLHERLGVDVREAV